MLVDPAKVEPHALTREGLARAQMLLKAYRHELPPLRLSIAPHGVVTAEIHTHGAPVDERRHAVDLLADLLHLPAPDYIEDIQQYVTYSRGWYIAAYLGEGRADV